MFGQNKQIPKDVPFCHQHHSLTPFLSVVSRIIYMELMVRLSFLLSSVLTNHNLGHRIAQVCVVFEILSRAVQEHQIFQSSMTLPTHLTYVEWFSPLSASPNINSKMYKVTKLVHKDRDSFRSVAIISVDSILCSIHLLPQFRSVTPWHCDTFSVLEQCDTSFVNLFNDRYNYLMYSICKLSTIQLNTGIQSANEALVSCVVSTWFILMAITAIWQLLMDYLA